MPRTPVNAPLLKRYLDQRVEDRGLTLREVYIEAGRRSGEFTGDDDRVFWAVRRLVSTPAPRSIVPQSLLHAFADVLNLDPLRLVRMSINDLCRRAGTDDVSRVSHLSDRVREEADPRLVAQVDAAYDLIARMPFLFENWPSKERGLFAKTSVALYIATIGLPEWRRRWLLTGLDHLAGWLGRLGVTREDDPTPGDVATLFRGATPSPELAARVDQQVLKLAKDEKLLMLRLKSYMIFYTKGYAPARSVVTTRWHCWRYWLWVASDPFPSSTVTGVLDDDLDTPSERWITLGGRLPLIRVPWSRGTRSHEFETLKQERSRWDAEEEP